MTMIRSSELLTYQEVVTSPCDQLSTQLKQSCLPWP